MLLLLSDGYNELAPILEKVEVLDELQWGELTVYHALKDGNDLLLAVTGYGKVNIGLALGYILSKHNVTIMIGIGNVASIDQNYASMKSVAIAERSLQWDVDFSAIGYPDTVVPNLATGTFFSSRNLVALAEGKATGLGYCANIGKFASGDYFVASSDLSDEIAEDFKANFIDSDAAFVAQIAYMFNIQFVYVKGVSNFANGIAAAEYLENKACANVIAANVAYNMLDDLLNPNCC